jgi:hypothetical protein
VTVSCGGAQHQARWARGELLLDDHDLAAEDVLVALGGEPPACLRVVALWREAVADGGFLEEWAVDLPDGPRRAWLSTALRRLRAEGVQDLLPGLAPRRAERMGRVLVELPAAFQDRAAVAAAARALEAAPPSPLARHVARAVQVRARRAFVTSLASWRRHVPIAALVPFRCRVGLGLGPAVEGVLAGRRSYCSLDLDASWLVDVWGAGLAVVAGHLVVAVDRSPSGRPPTGGPTTVGVWAVRWTRDRMPSTGRPGAPAPGPEQLLAQLALAELERPGVDEAWDLTWADGG